MENLERQLEKEQQAVDRGVTEYMNNVEAALNPHDKRLNVSTLSLMMRLIALYVEPLKQVIDERIEAAINGKAGAGSAIAPVLFLMHTRVLAFITLKICIDNAFSGAPMRQAISAIVEAFDDEYMMELIEDKNPRIAEKLEKRMSKASSQKQKRTMLKIQAKYQNCYEGIPVEHKTQAAIFCVESFVQLRVTDENGNPSPALITRELEVLSPTRRRHVLQPTPALINWLEKNNELFSQFSPKFYPTIIPPKNWVNGKDGGYWGELNGRLSLIRGARGELLEQMMSKCSQDVLNAVNKLQKVPYRINTRVYNFINEVITTNCNPENYGLCQWEAQDMPINENAIDSDTETWHEYKALYQRIEDANNSMAGKKIAVYRTMDIAREYLNEDKFYYVWNCDFRGRLYPVADYLQPQGNDLSKSLLLFSEGKALGSQEAVNALALTGAGLYGYDKVQFDKRIAWANTFTQEILDSARHPFECRWWTTADKPLQFLAWCFEWQGYCEQGLDYISHFPCQLDGSCNGLQHYAGLINCRETGAKVNLTFSDLPADIYQDTADYVANIIRSKPELTEDIDKLIHEHELVKKSFYALKDRADTGKTYDEAEMNKLKNRLSELEDIICPHLLKQIELDRKLFKRPVMTYPYSATASTMRNQISELFYDPDNADKYASIPYTWRRKVADYLGKLTYNSILHLVKGSARTMEWLQECAKLVTSQEKPMVWTSPAGFPVYQAYWYQKKKPVKCTVGSCTIKLDTYTNKPKINKQKQSNAIAPNYIHSCDAAMLMNTINTCNTQGIPDLLMVHDSYGTHAANVAKLSVIIRDEFIKMYEKGDVLENFRQEVINQCIDDSLKERVPELPEQGGLDITEVALSYYFFA